MKNIGTVIREHRIAHGLTQEELGSKVFVTKQAVSKWETGKTLPDIEMIRKLCDILEINKDEILGTSIGEAKKNRKLFKIFAVISAISIFIALFFGLGGFDYIDRHTQSGIVYLSVFSDGNPLTTDEYTVSSELDFKDLENAYKADINYGKIQGSIKLHNEYDIDFGFTNTNNWHNIHIRLDIQKSSVIQTITYETDNNIYSIHVTESTVVNNKASVFIEGI